MATLARMQVDLVARSDRYLREMRRASTATESLRRGFSALRNTMLLVTGVGGFGIAVRRTFDLGAAVEETGSKFRTVFGESSDDLDQFIARWGTIAGLSRTQAREVLATTGAIVQGMGLAQEASAEYARAVTELAGDLSSFNNVPIEETSRAIQAAVTSEHESLKRLGVVILETDVQRRAMVETGKQSAKQLTQEEKAAATLALITERAGVAVGDLARTQDSAANRARRLAAEFRDIREAIAAALLPVFNVVMREIENMLGGTATFVEFLKTSAPIMTAWAEVGVAAFGAVGESVRALFNIAFSLGQMLTSTFGAIVALMAGDMQVFNMLAEEIENAWVDMGESFVSVGDRLVELYDRVRIAMAVFGETTINFVRPALQNIEDGANQAATAAERLAAALSKLNAASSLLSGVSRVPGLGFLGGAASIAGIATGIINPLAGLGLFAGFFQGGGHIPAGQFGVVGESGPEIVTGPASVHSAASPLEINFTFPPPRSPTDMARDPLIARMFVEQVMHARENGLSFA